MRYFALALVLLLALRPAAAEDAPPSREFIVVTGGCALRFFEHGKPASHDMYWFNFIDASVIRWKEIKQQNLAQPTDHLTWLVYKPAYSNRTAEAGENQPKDLIEEIQNKATALGVSLLWFNSKDELVNYLNRGYNRHEVKIANFDYFGHSNKACFLFDYSNQIDGLSIDYLHVNDLSRINANIFDPAATCKSWGCHSGEMYSDSWKKRFGVAMEGAIGKTDFSHGGTPVLSDAQNGKWVK